MTLLDEYQAIRQGAAIGSISPRHQLAVAGPDRAAFLQGLVTNDVQALVPGTGCYAAWLTPQGRMLTDMHVLESAGMMLLDVPAGSSAATLARLDQFLFSEDVRLGSMADSLTGVWMHGPGAAAVVEAVVSGARALGEWGSYQHAQFEADGSAVSVARIDQVGVPGFCLYVEQARAASLVSALETAGAVAVGPDALAAARIEAGYPVFGIDMTEDTIPLEAGIEDRAISFTKGCYVGQEIVIRVLHRGGGRVARKLVGLRVAQGSPDPLAGAGAQSLAGAKVYSGEREIGHVTSAAVSPRLGIIALGYVHRDFVAAGTAIEVANGSRRLAAAVTERPMQAP